MLWGISKDEILNVNSCRIFWRDIGFVSWRSNQKTRGFHPVLGFIAHGFACAVDAQLRPVPPHRTRWSVTLLARTLLFEIMLCWLCILTCAAFSNLCFMQYLSQFLKPLGIPLPLPCRFEQCFSRASFTPTYNLHRCSTLKTSSSSPSFCSRPIPFPISSNLAHRSRNS